MGSDRQNMTNQGLMIQYPGEILTHMENTLTRQSSWSVAQEGSIHEKSQKTKGKDLQIFKKINFQVYMIFEKFNVAAHAPRARARPNKPKYLKHIFLIGNFANCIKSLPPSIHISAIHILLQIFFCASGVGFYLYPEIFYIILHLVC